MQIVGDGFVVLLADGEIADHRHQRRAHGARQRRRAAAARSRRVAGEFVEKFADRIRSWRSYPSGQLFRKRVNVFAVEHLVGALEQLADAFAMQFQLEAAQTQRADDDLAVTLLGLVGRLDAADSERRLRVAVGDAARSSDRPASRFSSSSCDADGAGREDDLRALDGRGARRVVRGLDRRWA